MSCTSFRSFLFANKEITSFEEPMAGSVFRKHDSINYLMLAFLISSRKFTFSRNWKVDMHLTSHSEATSWQPSISTSTSRHMALQYFSERKWTEAWSVCKAHTTWLGSQLLWVYLLHCSKRRKSIFSLHLLHCVGCWGLTGEGKKWWKCIWSIRPRFLILFLCVLLTVKWSVVYTAVYLVLLS